MLEFFLANENIPFSVSLVLLIGIALLEGITNLIGFGFSQFLENIIPDVDIPEADIDTDFEMETPSTFTRLLGWIKIKDVPMLVVLVAFLTFFSISGYIVQMISNAIIVHYLPWFIAIVPALLLALPMVRQSSLLLAKIVIKDHTEVVSTDSFIGQIAVISFGTAKAGSSAEAKLTDQYGQMHYIRVVPDDDNEEFTQNTEILLVKKEGTVFRAILNPNTKLTD